LSSKAIGLSSDCLFSLIVSIGPAHGTDFATAIALDSSGNVHVTGRSFGIGTWHDYATIRYDQMGVENRVDRYNEPVNFDDVAVALAVDPIGNVYVTGSSWGVGTAGFDYATIKYSQPSMADTDPKATVMGR
jgi:Beta-propeller repeat